jgi:cell division protein FtsZ
LITTPGLINLDFADVKTVMAGAGTALMGIGAARGEDRALQAAQMAVTSPLLDSRIDGAKGLLLSIAGGSDLGLFEINEAARLIAGTAHPEANIIFGAVIDDTLGDEVRVTVIAAGFAPSASNPMPKKIATPKKPEPAAEAEANAPTPTEAPKGKSTPDSSVIEAETDPRLVKVGHRPVIFDDLADLDDLDIPDFLK